MILSSFILFLLLFITVGVFSSTKSKKTSSDYLLASHAEKPWKIALAAVATNNSGYMFIGMIGYAYTNGISAFWIMICALIGDFCASLFIHQKFRAFAGKSHSLSFSELISKWGGVDYKILRVISALIVAIFLTVYAAAQFKAGGKAMEAIFGSQFVIGVILGGLVVLIYSSFGGIRASIWINTLQSFIMITSMALIFFSGLYEIGGFSNFFSAINHISPDFCDIFPDKIIFNQGFGLLFFLIGWFFGGFGIIGQPHIMTSFMALDKPESVKKIRIYYYSWYLFFFALTIGTGLIARILIPFDGIFDPELALPTLAKNLLPEFLIGFILAGLFSATLSTADSQILSSSAAITNDLLPKKRNSYAIVKANTAIIAFFATSLALFDNQSVFSLVMIAWLALACSFSPLIIVYAMGGKISQKMALTMMFFGFTSMMIWRHFNLGDAVYEAAPGIICGLIPYLVCKFFKKTAKLF